MTIQPPPNDEIPPDTPIDTPDDEPREAPPEPEQRAPGAEQPPIGAPTDEPDLNLR
jgi:hypothetical protein